MLTTIHDKKIRASCPSISKVDKSLRKPSAIPQHVDQCISIQLAGSFETLSIELAFQAIELLLAEAVVFGSNGGAWLGLALSSHFRGAMPQGSFLAHMDKYKL